MKVLIDHAVPQITLSFGYQEREEFAAWARWLALHSYPPAEPEYPGERP